MSLRSIPSAVEQTGDRQTLAIQANTKPLRDAANANLFRLRTVAPVALVAAEAAALTVSTRGIYVADADYRLARAFLFSRGNLTADDTNYATVALHAGGVTGTQRRELARFATKVTGGQGNWTVASILTFGITGANISAGEALFFRTIKTGTGVIVPACTIQLDLVPR